MHTKLALAPMAGVTDLAFRALCREMTPLLTTSEMVSSRGIMYGDEKTLRLLALCPGERGDGGVQIFGHDPGCMAEAAVRAAELSGAAFVDINMGCPTPKIVKSGDGCALMERPELAARIIRAAADASPVPVSVKFRTGLDRGRINAVAFAQTAEQSGAFRLCVHGRTMAQMYAGTADWDRVRDVAAAVRLPVIASGDIFSGRDALRVLRHTGASHAMIGRAAFGNPWIFREAHAVLLGQEPPDGPSPAERVDMALRQYEMTVPYRGEEKAALEARKFFAWYLKGLPYVHVYRPMLNEMRSRDDVLAAARALRRDLS